MSISAAREALLPCCCGSSASRCLPLPAQKMNNSSFFHKGTPLFFAFSVAVFYKKGFLFLQKADIIFALREICKTKL